MKGTDSTGRRYHALNPEAYHWVHATLVKGPVDAQSLFGKGMTDEETEAYYREMRDVGRVWGLKDHHLPPDWAAFTAYYDDMVDNRLECNESVRNVLDELSHPAKPFRLLPGPLWRPFARIAAHYALLVTVGALPPRLRDRFGLTWSRLPGAGPAALRPRREASDDARATPAPHHRLARHRLLGHPPSGHRSRRATPAGGELT